MIVEIWDNYIGKYLVLENIFIIFVIDKRKSVGVNNDKK